MGISNVKLTDMMARSIGKMFTDVLRLSAKNLTLGSFVMNTVKWQREASSRRKRYEKEGLHVPPFIIASITSRCNLSCKGCYAASQKRKVDSEMSIEKWSSILAQCRDLGISIVLVAGGEPLTRPDFIDLAGSFREIVFPVFTNGLLINTETISKLERFRNIVPVMSVEGNRFATDDRRGDGVFQKVAATATDFRQKDMFFGLSITLTKMNFQAVTSDDFLRDMVERGCRLFFLVEYVPAQEGTNDWVLDDNQRLGLGQIMESKRAKFPAIFVAFPGDEDMFGGCLAAGRGFIHISPEGNVEPCPFIPYSDVNLSRLTLKEALGSQFLQKIRENHALFEEGKGGCALWDKRSWLEDLLTGRPSGGPCGTPSGRPSERPSGTPFME